MDINGSESFINTERLNGIAFLLLSGNYTTIITFHITDTTDTITVLKKDPNFVLSNYVSKESSGYLRVKACSKVVIFGK